jgi:mannose-6-phosphate isomerase-like protein (cupin superfamily)
MNADIRTMLNGGEGESYWVLGDLYTFKATGKQTNSQFTLIEQVVHPQSGPPPHVHHREDEVFYVLNGKFSFLSGDKQGVFDTGATIYIPKGTLHTFKNIDEQKGRLLVLITPAGLEEFFYAIGTPAVDKITPPVFDPAVIEKVMRLAKDYHMSIIPPDEKIS